jgi:hypothetical protein
MLTHRERVRVTSVTCLLLAVLTIPPSFACTQLYAPKEIAPDFSVEVMNHGMGIADLHVEVWEHGLSSGNSKPVLVAITNHHGAASFHLERPGAYSISVKNIELALPEEIVIKGTASKGALAKIAIQLPEDSILAVRSISGSIHVQSRTDKNVANPEAPLVDLAAGIKLTLIRAHSEEIVESHLTSEVGEFSFSALPDGLYFLHIEAPADATMQRRALDGYIPVAINAAAKMPNLNLNTFPGICTSFAYRNGAERS